MDDEVRYVALVCPTPQAPLAGMDIEPLIPGVAPGVGYARADATAALRLAGWVSAAGLGRLSVQPALPNGHQDCADPVAAPRVSTDLCEFDWIDGAFTPPRPETTTGR